MGKSVNFQISSSKLCETFSICNHSNLLNFRILNMYGRDDDNSDSQSDMENDEDTLLIGKVHDTSDAL